jgi:hypothetical protein
LDTSRNDTDARSSVGGTINMGGAPVADRRGRNSRSGLFGNKRVVKRSRRPMPSEETQEKPGKIGGNLLHVDDDYVL